MTCVNIQTDHVLNGEITTSRISPAYLEILIHCHCVPSPIEDSDAVELFLRDGIIEPDPRRNGPGMYQTTDKGAAWLEMMLATPYPVNKWIDPRLEP